MDLQTLKKFSKNTIYFGFIDEVKGFVSMEIDITNYVCNLYYAKNNERYSFPFRYIKKLENNQQKQTIKFILKDTQLKNFTCLSDKDYANVIELIDLIIKNQHSKIKTLFREISSQITLELCNGKMRKFGDLIILLTNNRIFFFDSMKSEDLPILVLCIKGLTSSKKGKTDVKVEIKKKSFEISFENEYDRDFWFEALQKACSLSEEQAIKIADKIDSLTVLLYSKFNGTNESHLNLLKRLWDGTIKKIVKEDISNVSEYWKKLGFSSANIEINAKEKGFFLVVEGLVFLMDQYPSVFKLIFNNSQTKNFPLCVVCLKFVDWLSDTLGLEKKEKGIPLHLPTLCTFPNFTHDLFAFELILGITLQLFDEMWKNAQMNLNEIVEGVIQQVTQFLEKLPRGGIPHIFENMLFVLGEKSISSSMNEYDIEKDLSFANKFMMKNKENSKDSLEDKSISGNINTAFLKEVISSDPSKKINDISIFSQRNWFSKYLDSSEERRDVVTLPIDFNSKASLEQLTEKRFLLKQLNQKHRKLSSNYEVQKSKHLCVSCKTKEREIVLLPCSHLSLCSECHTKMATQENCPLCKSKRVGSFKINKV